MNANTTPAMNCHLRSIRDAVVSNKDEEDQNQASPKTVNIVFGFFFLINYAVGIGFLGIPFAFFHEGILTGIVTLLIVAFVSWIAAIWVLEVMARAQVYKLVL